MPVTIYPGTLKKRNSDGTYSDLVPAVNTGGSAGSDNNIADDYRPTTTYAMGDHVLYSGVLYRCISASGATGTWDSTKWDAVTVGEEIENIEGAIDDLESDLLSNFAANYNASASYTIGKYCIHDGQLYRCIVAIPSPGEAWNSSHWATTNISNHVYNTIIKISNQYNPARTYKKDEVCIYGDALKYCKIDMTGPEAWNFSHWGTVTGVMDVVGSGQLDSSFEADNLTGAANELKNTLNNLGSDDVANDSNVSGATVTAAINALNTAVTGAATNRIYALRKDTQGGTTFTITFPDYGSYMNALMFGRFGYDSAKLSMAIVSHPSSSVATIKCFGDQTANVTCAGDVVTVTTNQTYADVTVLSMYNIS